MPLIKEMISTKCWVIIVEPLRILILLFKSFYCYSSCYGCNSYSLSSNFICIFPILIKVGQH